MASAIRNVQAALVAKFTTAVPAGASVHNGPRKRGNRPSQYLLVGVNGIDEDAPGLRSAQERSPMNGVWREEAGEVDCTVVAWSGDPDGFGTIRAAADGIVAACEAAVNADPQLGGVLQPRNNFAELTALDIREAHTDKGPFVEAVFTISYSTVLT